MILKNKYRIVIVVICFILSIKGYSEVKFESEFLKNSYDILPENVKKTIDSSASDNYSIPMENMLQNGRINIQFNKVGEVSHIGINIKTKEDKEKYNDLDLFVENIFQNIYFASNNSFIFNYLKHNNVEFYSNNRQLKTISLKEWKSIINKVVLADMSVYINNSAYYATWIFGSNDAFSIKIPADINLIKRMDKGELENQFIHSLLSYEYSNEKQTDLNYTDLITLNNGLFLFRGDKFDNNNFRSDIFLSKKNNTNYILTYNSDFPVESFSNLFITNYKKDLSLETTFILYRNRKEKHRFLFNAINTYLQKECNPYFGLYKNDHNVIKATVIYFNPLYRYAHMLVVEADKSMLFEGKEKVINATLYLYIPRVDVKKELEIKNTNAKY